MTYYDEYFDVQRGGGRTGYGGISHVYIGSPNQRGHGIGSFLGGLFRRILPLLKQGARAVGKEAVRTGINVATDIMDSGVRPKEAFKTRLRESGENLKRKAEEKLSTLMQGSGYKASKINKLMHSLAERASRRTTVKKRKKRSARAGQVQKKKKKATARKTRKTTTKRRKKSRTVTDIFA